MRHLLRQASCDFGLIPELVEEYVEYIPSQKAIRDARGVAVIHTYKSRAMGFRSQTYRGAYAAVMTVAVNAVNDRGPGTIPMDEARRALFGLHSMQGLDIIEPMCHLARSEGVYEAMLDGFRWQNDTLEQEGEITPERAAELTRQKGGLAALITAHLLDPDVTERKEELMYDFGYAVQLMDDYRDRELDRAEGVTTPLTAGIEDHDSILDRVDAVQHDWREVYGSSRAERQLFRLLRTIPRAIKVVHAIPGLPANHPRYPY